MTSVSERSRAVPIVGRTGAMEAAGNGNTMIEAVRVATSTSAASDHSSHRHHSDMLPPPRSQRPSSRTSLSTNSSKTQASLSLNRSLQTPSVPDSVVLKVSVKQRNGSIATITTTPAKVTRGFSSPSAQSRNESPKQTGDPSYDLMPPEYFTTSPVNTGVYGTSYGSSSRASIKSLTDTGVYGSGESAGSGLMSSRRIYSNASSASASSLQTFFGVGEGQLLKERLRREQEMKDHYYQQLALQQQQEQMQNSRSTCSQRVDSKVDSREMTSTTADETSSNLSSETRKKASFAIGGNEEEEDESDAASSASPLNKSHRNFTIKTSSVSKQSSASPEMITPDSLEPQPAFGASRSSSVAKKLGDSSSTSPMLPRRTFPSAPYLPLYSKPNSMMSPIQAPTKLLLNPNPNSSSAADVPIISAKPSPALKPSSSTSNFESALTFDKAAALVCVAGPIPITKSSSQNTKMPTLAAGVQPPEVQAPLHSTPSAHATSEADVQAAAAAERARGQNVPRTLPDFHRRLQDLRNHHIQQLSALREQILILKSRGESCEYYEHEMGRVIDGAKKEEGYLIEYGRKGMGIDGELRNIIVKASLLTFLAVNTLTLMLSNLRTFDPSRPSTVRPQYPAVVRKTKSTTHLPMPPPLGPLNNPLQQYQQPIPRTHSQQRMPAAGYHEHAPHVGVSRPIPTATTPIPRTRSHARVLDLNSVQQHAQLVHVVVPTQQQQIEFLQRQYDVQVAHMSQAPAAVYMKPPSVPNPAIYSTVPGQLSGGHAETLYEDDTSDYDEEEESEGCQGRAVGSIAATVPVAGMESSGEVSLVASDP
ncbi:hypothetical protein BC830DRAFT_1144681 [Chytriomyces sp. MP71]|nr:hypothetical protein BC830DRAFT_1144681 [Chytriomyces sp. MP71]